MWRSYFHISIPRWGIGFRNTFRLFWTECVNFCVFRVRKICSLICEDETSKCQRWNHEMPLQEDRSIVWFICYWFHLLLFIRPDPRIVRVPSLFHSTHCHLFVIYKGFRIWVWIRLRPQTFIVPICVPECWSGDSILGPMHMWAEHSKDFIKLSRWLSWTDGNISQTNLVPYCWPRRMRLGQNRGWTNGDSNSQGCITHGF